VSDPRPEHVQAISWLNASVQGTEFYLLKVEAIAIGDSAAAPLFTKIVGPSEATRQARETRTEIAERHQIRRDFWTALLERARSVTAELLELTPEGGRIPSARWPQPPGAPASREGGVRSDHNAQAMGILDTRQTPNP
jgi:hypothetical protein